MKDLKELDKNFAIETNIIREGLSFYNIDFAPFKIYGVFKEKGLYRRLPDEYAKQISEGVYEFSKQSAGGRVRFVTDSPYIVLKTKLIPGKMDHFALTGSAGFDMYAEWKNEHRYMGTFRPPVEVTDGYEAVKDFSQKIERIFTINFPLYSCVEELYIGVQEGCILREAPEYAVNKPIVFYGSSITQGGCASKPSSCYQSILSRQFGFDYINLGFSGSARGEDLMIDYIKKLDMSMFVMDYDFNAQSIEELENTHEKLFLAVRKSHPDIPILILPRPNYYVTSEDERVKIIERTYKNAKDGGDDKVFYITSRKLMDVVRDNGTVDGIHPTDSGFFSMACAIAEVFEQVLPQVNTKQKEKDR